MNRYKLARIGAITLLTLIALAVGYYLITGSLLLNDLFFSK